MPLFSNFIILPRLPNYFTRHTNRIFTSSAGETSSTFSQKIITPEFLSNLPHNDDNIIYIHDRNVPVNKSLIQSKFCTPNAKLYIANALDVDYKIISRYEITTLPVIIKVKNGIVKCITEAYNKPDVVIAKNERLTHQVDLLKSLVFCINSEIDVIAKELANFIADHRTLFPTQYHLLQIAASSAISFSDLPCYTIDQLHALLTSKESMVFNNEMSILVDSSFSSFYGDEIALHLSNISTDTIIYSGPQFQARIYRAISSRYYRTGDNKRALEYAYKSFNIDLNHQNSMLNTYNIFKTDPYKIDLYSDSIATTFLKHLIIALGTDRDVFEIRPKIEFAFRSFPFVPLKIKPNGHPPGGPPMKGRGYRAKWIWHGLDYRPKKYKPRNIFKYHDEWKAIHDEPVLNY